MIVRVNLGVIVVLALPLSTPAVAQTPDTSPPNANSASKTSTRPRGQSDVPVMERIVSLNASNVRLEALLDEIDRQAGILLQYTPRVVPVNKHITVHLDRVPLATALDSVLAGTGVRAVVTPSGRVMLVSSATQAADTGTGVVGGRVIDSLTARPLDRVVVVINSAALTAMTNDSGYYVFQRVPVGLRVVRAKRVGYQVTERLVMVADSQFVRADFLLSHAATSLDAVIVTATGPRRRVELGNDITILRADSIVTTQPVSSVTELLATRVPGLEVQHTSGAPGDPARLRLRGASSINLSNDPVIIVDGVRVYYAQSDPRSGNVANVPNSQVSQFAAPSPLDQIDPNAVETIEVLKGPSAATMYGPDAANGVIVITTKRGRVGPPRWTVGIDHGRTFMPGRYPDAYFRWGHVVANSFFPSSVPVLCPPSGGTFSVFCIADSLVRFQALNDPTTTVLGQGNRTAMTVSVSGGVSGLTYAVTGSVDDETGILTLPIAAAERFAEIHGTPPPDWMQRPQTLNVWRVSSTLGAQLGSKAHLSLSTLVTHESQRNSSLEGQVSSLLGAYVDRATGALYPQAGQGFSFPSPDLVPAFYTRATDEATNFTNTLSLSWQPLRWLVASAEAGLNVINRNDEALEPHGANPSDSSGAISVGQPTSLVKSANVRATATAALPLGFRFQTALGANYTGISTAGLVVSGNDIPAGTSSISLASNINTSQDQLDQATFGWYVEPSINNSRFFLSTGLRLDGGTAYGSHVGLVGNPKLGVSYLVSDEPWFPHALKPVFNSLRVRAAYGRATVEPGLGALRLYAQSRKWLDGQFTDVASIQALGNTHLEPERSREFEGGFDAEILGDRLSVSFSGYRKTRYNALLAVPLAPSVGGFTITRNIGTIANSGIEITLGAELVHTDLVTCHTDLNLFSNRNRVLSLIGSEPIDLGGNQRVVVGYPLFGFWARPILGYADANHDGIIEANEVLVGDSVVFMGARDPNYQAALHTTLSLFGGAVSIAAALDYQNGLTQFNQAGLGSMAPLSRGLYDPTAPFGEQAAAAAASVTPYGVLQTVSTLRWTSLAIAYRIPAPIAHRVGANAMNLALQGTNLGLWTTYRGKDPDVNAYATGNAVADTGILPVPRTWQIRVNVSY